MARIITLVTEDIPNPDLARFIHRSADGGMRLRECDGGYILEEHRYANRNEFDEILEYPETAWVPVPLLKRP